MRRPTLHSRLAYRTALPSLLVLIATLLACGGAVQPSSDVGADCYRYDDRTCQETGKCHLVGDMVCYRRCVTDDDCAGIEGTACVTLWLFNGGDACSPSSTRICRPPDVRQCG